VSVEPIAEHEQSGSRPVLMGSATDFNAATQLPLILPITNGGQFDHRSGYAVALLSVKTTSFYAAISRAL